MGEELYELPKGWVWVELGDILNPSPEKVEPSKLQQNLPYIGLEHINKDTGKLLSIGNSIDVRSTKTKFYSEDLLYGKLRPYLNKVYVPIFDGICSTDILVFSKNQYVSSHYIAFRFLAKDFVRFANQNVSGVQHPRIDFKTLSRFKIPLPPLPEQYRIVAKIEELFTELDAGVELLKKLKAKLKRYRQAVLKAAVEGNLTQEWREANQGKLEPASMLLERILKQRREKWEAEQLAKMKTQGKTPKDDSWKLKYKEPVAPDTSELPELPDGWCWGTMEQISTKVVDGVHKKPNYVSEGIPFITVRNLTAGYGIDFTNVKYITLDDHKLFCQRANPEKGDILITKDGTLGVTRVIKTDKEFSIFVSVAMMKPFKDYLNSDYLAAYITSPSGQNKSQKMGEGSGLKHLHLEDLRSMQFPIPPLTEQAQITEAIEQIFSVTDQLEKTIDSNLKRAEKLRQSILKQAFEGKLVPQDPNDEPAEKLLERIKAEKAKQTTTKTKRKTQSKTKSDLQLELPLK